MINNNLISSKILFEMCFYTCKEDKQKAGELYDILTNNFNKYLTDSTTFNLTTRENNQITLRILNTNNYTNDELKYIKENIVNYYHNFDLNNVNKKIEEINDEQKRKIEENLNEKHERRIKCLKRWEKVKIYFHRQLFLKKFDLIKTKIENTLKNLKNLIKKKKNEIKLKERIKINFEKCHNKIPINYIYNWRYSPTFRALYNENRDILKIFNNKENKNLDKIMGIYQFTINDWKIWSDIVIDKKFDISCLPNYLLEYYKYLNKEKDFLKDNNTKKTNQDEDKSYINYNIKIFNQNYDMTNRRENISCPIEYEDKEKKFYDLISKDFFTYDDVIEILKEDKMNDNKENIIHQEEYLKKMKKIEEKEQTYENEEKEKKI